ncbi:GNAT family N-acetyltransferase [Actinoallomurus purpureus]|uniref:GNAT family N-acetyltransferase n=1 Tax=Actinoallomurus purpureus TaxID=478114 RepID=UPI002092F5BE|nr:GNAT family protein [Actinoallomurus purpureus]MCO6009878.1 GNAT family N-acetyltransferase [Actinoallomurus purpureus]
MSEIPKTYSPPSGDACARANGVSLPGGRVDLRRISAEDRCRFTELAAASSELHRPWISLPITPDGFDRYLARFDQDTAVGFVVCLRGNPTDLVGFVTIKRIEYAPYWKGVLGYGAFVPWHGRGYMTEGVALAVRYGFERLGLHRLEADIEPENMVAQNLAENVGLRREGFSPGLIRIGGVWRDFERWAIIAESMN